MWELRLGDTIDDFCIKCRRLTNHAIVSLVDGKAAKVRCRTCYNDHDYRHEQAPPSKKDLKKAELFKEVLAGVAPSENGEIELPLEAVDEVPADLLAEDAPGSEEASIPPVEDAPAPKKGRGRAKKT